MSFDFTELARFLDYMAKKRTPGCAVRVCVGGKEVFSYSAGYSDLEDGIRYKGHEHINIYSCSKVATVTAGAQLVERGVINLNDPLYAYIPEYKDMCIRDKDGNIRKAERHIKVGDLFSMTAGFNYNLKAPSILKAGEVTDGKYDTETVVRMLSGEPLSFEPGTHWQYSLCHDVLAGLVEIVSGEKFRDYMKHNIFEPLGMNDTAYHITPEIEKNMASQYTFVADSGEVIADLAEAHRTGRASDGTYKKISKTDIPYVFGEEYDSGGAGITTTPKDYIKLVAALSGGGLGMNGERILSPYTVELMKTNRLGGEQLKDAHTWAVLAGYGYGMGVRTHMNRGESGCNAPIGEFGWGGAAGATVIADTENDVALFFAQHCLNPREDWYQPRLKNVLYGCLR